MQVTSINIALCRSGPLANIRPLHSRLLYPPCFYGRMLSLGLCYFCVLPSPLLSGSLALHFRIGFAYHQPWPGEDRHHEPLTQGCWSPSRQLITYWLVKAMPSSRFSRAMGYIHPSMSSSVSLWPLPLFPIASWHSYFIPCGPLLSARSQSHPSSCRYHSWGLSWNVMSVS